LATNLFGLPKGKKRGLTRPPFRRKLQAPMNHQNHWFQDFAGFTARIAGGFQPEGNL
jgi:hypothetical protein